MKRRIAGLGVLAIGISLAAAAPFSEGGAGTPQAGPVSAQAAQRIDFSAMGLTVLSVAKEGKIERYEVQISDPARVLAWGAGEVLPRMAARALKGSGIARDLRGARFVVEIDWRRYERGESDSIHLYPLQTAAQTRDTLPAKLAKEHRGVYLTVDKAHGHISGRVEPMDFLSASADKNFLQWKGAGFDCNAGAEKKSCTLNGGHFSVGSRGGKSPGVLTIEGAGCSYTVDAHLLGMQECHLPVMKLSFIQGQEKSDFELEKLRLRSDVSPDGNTTVNYRAFLELGKFAGKVVETNQTTTFTFDGLSLSGGTEHLDRSAWEGLTMLLEGENNATGPANAVLWKKRLIHLLSDGNLYRSGLKLSSAEFEVTSPKQTVQGSLRDWQDDYALTLGEFVRYDEENRIAEIDFAQRGGGNALAGKVRGFALGYGLDRLYNPLPDFVDLVVDVATQPGGPSKKLTPEQEQRIREILTTMVHKGIQAHLAPLRIEKVTFSQGGLPSFGPLAFQAKAKLKANSVDLNNPMAPMMLLGSLLAHGELRLTKRDFRMLLPLLPPALAKMARMIALREGDTVRFVIRF
uniref:hypothetical protein n=1 Tax=Nitratifractor sp. TaxID=2268144 RepID=UPI0025F52761